MKNKTKTKYFIEMKGGLRKMEEIKSKVEGIKAEIPRTPFNRSFEYALKKFNLPSPFEDNFIRITGQAEVIERELTYIGQDIQKREYLEQKLSEETDDGKKDLIRFILAREVYPRLSRDVGKFVNREQYGWLHFRQYLEKKIWRFAGECEIAVSTTKKSIRDKEVLHELLYSEAQEYNLVNQKELSQDYPDDTSPPNRAALTHAADLWVLAGENEKAEKHYLKAGLYEYEHAATKFEEIGDEQRAIKFWTLSAQHPHGYMDELELHSAFCWERLGNIPQAIKSFEKAIEVWTAQEGSYDLHGDPKSGKEEAGNLRRRVEKLREILASGKKVVRNPQKIYLEDTFHFRFSVE